MNIEQLKECMRVMQSSIKKRSGVIADYEDFIRNTSTTGGMLRYYKKYLEKIRLEQKAMKKTFSLLVKTLRDNIEYEKELEAQYSQQQKENN